ncbi:MAG TPA: Ig-like domain-containing protein, partial [Gemmatimonadaceae bacterium]|nr:Ig-like domain-containing protein [Gemmatimonadaceae bacterium]
TAVAPGSASIVATSEGVKGEIAVSVSQAAVASVTVNLIAGSLAVGQTAQATATALDASGKALSGRVVTWTITPTSVATVSSSGVVTAVAAGSATLTATVEGKSASVTVTVTAPVVVTQPPPSGALTVMPELPRAVVVTATSATPSNGASIRVPAGGDLQGAIDQAKPGDVILLAPGASYTGNFVLRAKSGAGDGAWITIRTETTLPAEGTRVTPTTAASFAKLLTPNASPVIATDPAASYYRISGVAIAPGATSTLAYGLVAFGDAGPAQNTLASVPHHLIVDRSYIHSSATFNLRRCVAVHSAWTAVVDSWLADCHSNDGDSQAIWGSNGPGPFTIVNNYLEGAGENVMFGGADSRAPALLPADITLRRNHIVKPASWVGVWTVKNLLELKVGQRVLVEGNLLEGAWVSGQIGFAILLKSSDQDNTAPWSTTQDVTLRLNRISRAAAGISVMGTIAGDLVTNSTARVLVEHNLIDPVGDPALGGVGRLFQSGATTPPRDVVYRHNTGFGTNAGFIFTEGSQPGFVFLDNVVNGHPDYQWSFSSSDGHGVATAALDYHAPGWKVAGNVIVGGGVQVRPPDNFFPATMGEVGFTDAGGAIGTSFTPGDYRLTASSPYKGKATDGTDPGVDFGRLSTALAGVRVQP